MVNSEFTGAVYGIGGYLVTVEADMSNGLPCLDMVGFLGSEVKEASHRVRVAIKNSGFTLPPMRYTINLSPASIRKQGSGFDLAMAVCLLRCIGAIPEKSDDEEKRIIIGELGLKGNVRGVNGVLPIIIAAVKEGVKECIIPSENVKEAGCVEGINVIGVSSLEDTIAYLRDGVIPKTKKSNVSDAEDDSPEDGQNKKIKKIEILRHKCHDFEDIVGHDTAKRAAEIAAAGFHNLLLSGPPGTGKSMIASALCGILPPMSREEMLDTSTVYSVAGLLTEEEYFITERPFLNPHHTITPVALVGGGSAPSPGIISLANHGVLFLDEFPEFKRPTLDLLRQPIEEGEITINRKNGNYRYPCDIMLVAAMNPCPCGYYPDRKRCHCSETDILRYRKQVSGPLLDRIDICVSVSNNKYEELSKNEKREKSEKIRKRICAARKIQQKRNGKDCFNARIDAKDIMRICVLSSEAKELTEKVYNEKQMSMRGLHRMMRVARTIADLAGSDLIEKEHMLEAAGYRGILSK